MYSSHRNLCTLYLVFLDHPQRYKARQYIGHEGGGYEQQRDEQSFKGRDTSLQHTLFLVVSVDGVVDGVMEAAALLTFEGPAGDEVAHIDHIAQFADILRGLDTLEETLRLLVEHIQTVPGAMQS